MNWTQVTFNILTVVLPSLIVFLTAYYVLKLFLDKRYAAKYLQIKMDNMKHILPLRLKAFERITLFLERVRPDSLIHRIRKTDMTSAELQIALVSSIRSEFEHNLSQQIYLSDQTWTMVKAAKEETISTINQIASSMPETSSGLEMSRAIFNYYINSNQPAPSEKALSFVHAEVKYLYEEG